MGHTYHKVYLQFVFAVKYRNAVLDKKWHKLQTCASKGNLVIEWAIDHREELLEDWELIRNDNPPNKIEPLI